MRSYFHALAVDYDGTLTDRPSPDPAALSALGALRADGCRVVLVTGRILAELRADFPAIDAAPFDAIVAENGAVLATPAGTRPAVARPLVAPVDPALDAALRARGVPVRRGQVLLATDAPFAPTVLAGIAALGLDCQVVHNRQALMVLPAGVTKGTGVVAALEELGLSPHNAVAVGDAENDHALLAACEIGVAVGNAVDALKAHADVVLAGPDGAGLTAFVRGRLRDGLPEVEPRRRRLTLGTFDDGTPVCIPASRVNVGIYGDSGAGKSYLAGLLAEQLVRERYVICVIDLEGDHGAIGELHGVVTVAGRELPEPRQLVRQLAHGFTSLVVDLCLLEPDAKRAYAHALLRELRQAREATGLPHWVFVDEAHVPMSTSLEAWWCAGLTPPGLCLVTYRPDALTGCGERRSEIVVELRGGEVPTLRRPGWPEARHFHPATRQTAHVRHRHKYVEARLPYDRRFFFRTEDALTGRAAGNVAEFCAELARADEAVLRHHARLGDFTRWLGGLVPPPDVLDAARAAERAIDSAGSVDALRDARDRLVSTLATGFAP